MATVFPLALRGNDLDHLCSGAPTLFRSLTDVADGQFLTAICPGYRVTERGFTSLHVRVPLSHQTAATAVFSCPWYFIILPRQWTAIDKTDPDLDRDYA